MRLAHQCFAAAWVALVVYAAFLGVQINHVLKNHYELQGFTRSYRSPYQLGNSYLYDPREGSIQDELKARYNVNVAITPDASAEQWEIALTQANVPFSDCSQSTSAEPKLLFLSDHTTILQIKENAQKSQLFFPNLGMALAETPKHLRCIALHVKHVTAW